MVVVDTNSIHASDAVVRLVQAFADPSVGYASGRLVYKDPSGSVIGECVRKDRGYVERFRFRESTIGSLLSVNGGIDAI